MQIKNLKVNPEKIKEGLFIAGISTVLIGTIAGALCLPIVIVRKYKANEKSPFYFTGFNDAQVAEYYDFKYEDGEEYFVEKDVLLDAIPDYKYAYDLGLKVDENGNTIVIEPNDIDSSVDKVLHYCQKDVDDETGKEKVTLSTPAEVKVVNGYKLISKNDVRYDIKKSDIVTAQNNRKLSDNYLYLEANATGGADTVEYIRK